MQRQTQATKLLDNTRAVYRGVSWSLHEVLKVSFVWQRGNEFSSLNKTIRTKVAHVYMLHVMNIHTLVFWK